MLKIAKKEQFLEKVKEVDSIICFGSGKRIEYLCNIFKGTNIWRKIICFVDNDINKQNLKILLPDSEVIVVSFDYLKSIDISNSVFLITCAAYTEILEKIDKIESLKNIECYCLSHMIGFEKEKLALKKKLPQSLKRSNTMLIPKVIHYCWFGGNPLPDKYKMWMESWHKYCPDYKIIEWNEDNYDISKIKYMEQAYKQKKWGFVPDVARLDIIYQYGGIYLDTDVELINNIDELLYQKGFAGFESDRHVALGLGFGAISGLPIIKEMLDMYKEINFVNKDGSLNLTASPVWQTELLKQKGMIANGEYQVINDLTIMPEKVLCGKNGNSKRLRLTPYTRAIHHYEGSWLNEKQKYLNKRFEREMNEIID